MSSWRLAGRLAVMDLEVVEPHEHVVPVSDRRWGIDEADQVQTHVLTADCDCEPFAYLRIVDGRATGTEYRHNSFKALPVDEQALEAIQQAQRAE